MPFRFRALAVIGFALLVACGGGGGGTTPPAPVPTLAGGGSSIPADQRISLSVTIPANVPGVLAKRRHASFRTQLDQAQPYLSPKTSSIVLSLALINGQSPINVVPNIPVINIGQYCANQNGGCNFTTPANIPAAKATNEYIVTTYSGPSGTGNVVSVGFINVVVPPASSAKLGGTAALTAGGYVASILIGSVSAATFAANTPSTLGLLVQAFDPAGAAIIGNTQFANRIEITVSDTVNFTVGGPSAKYELAQPITTPIPLAYNGGVSLRGGATVNASTTDENGATATAPPFRVTIVGTPPPTAPPTPAAESLYVAYADTDRIEEYDFAGSLEAGVVPAAAPTPRRAITVASPAPSSPITCTAWPAYTGVLTNNIGIGGVAVTKSGTVYVSTGCTSNQTTSYTFGVPATAAGLTPPTISDTVGFSYGIVDGGAMATDQSSNSVYTSYLNSATNGGLVATYPADVSAPAPSIQIGSFATNTICIPQLPANPGQNSSNCNNYASYVPNQAAGYGVVQGTLFMPAATEISGPLGFAFLNNAVAVIPVVDSSATGLVTASTAIVDKVNPAGPGTVLGGYISPVGPVGPVTATVDGTMLYVLLNATNDGAGPAFNYGLSACPPPSSNAPLGSTAITCADQSAQHEYLAGYQLTPDIFGASNVTVARDPSFVIGGDVVGRFGCSFNSGTAQSSGEYLAAHNGYVYVLNPDPTCPGATSLFAPEIDIYNTNGVTGVHTDVKPVFVLAPSATKSGSDPIAVTLGTRGTVVGGLAVHRGPYRASNARQLRIRRYMQNRSRR